MSGWRHGDRQVGRQIGDKANTAKCKLYNPGDE